MKKTQKELLHHKWYDFGAYKESDYRQVFNYEALYLDDIYRNGAFLKDIHFDETIEELNYDTYEVLEKIIEDIEEVGINYVSMLGFGMSIKEWKKFIKNMRKQNMRKTYNEKLKHHHEQALEHLWTLEDMTHYELKDISDMIDKLQDMDFENYDLLKEEE